MHMATFIPRMLQAYSTLPKHKHAENSNVPLAWSKQASPKVLSKGSARYPIPVMKLSHPAHQKICYNVLQVSHQRYEQFSTSAMVLRSPAHGLTIKGFQFYNSAN